MNRAIKMNEKRTKRNKEESIGENPDDDFPLVFHIPIFLSRPKSFLAKIVPPITLQLHGVYEDKEMRNLMRFSG
jgi:hypothetical protein